MWQTEEFCYQLLPFPSESRGRFFRVSVTVLSVLCEEHSSLSPWVGYLETEDMQGMVFLTGFSFSGRWVLNAKPMSVQRIWL